MKLNVVIGADHGGFEMKEQLLSRLAKDYEVADAGAYEYNPADDYTDFALSVAQAVAGGRATRGILVCGSGVGACITANKVPGIRACLCHDTYSAHQGVEHDDMNVLCLGARVIGIEMAYELTVAFLNARFSGEERHRRRLQKLLDIERQALQGGDKGEAG